MPNNQFKFYALHYLNNVWASHDRPCCEALGGSTEQKKLKTLASAAVFYSIARNLPTGFEEREKLPRYGSVLAIIDTLQRKDFLGEKLLPAIKRVSGEISAKYGGQGVLSATTKFLWLKMKNPIIIFDGRAREGLRIVSDRQSRGALRGAPDAIIDEYYGLWREEFKVHEEEIGDACATLEKMHEYADPKIGTGLDIAKIAAEPWFRERVFDVYLWDRGSPTESHA